MKRFIYADNAATTKIDVVALEAMKPYLYEQYGNASQPYFLGHETKRALLTAREKIAKCINAKPEEIYFTSGGTESDNWAIKGTAFCDSQKKAMITSSIEHHAILNSCKAIERLGYPVAYLFPNNDGTVSVDTLKRIITNNTRLVSIMLANNEIGTIEPIQELASEAHRYGALFHTDAVQAVGHIPIDVKALGVDLLSSSAHKFNGPKGIGFLYIKKGTPICPHNDGGSQEYGLRAGTENVASIVGMSVALEENLKCMKSESEKLRMYDDIFMKEIQGLDYIRNGSPNRIPGNICLSFRNASGEAILHRMDLNGICISTGSACDSKKTQVSHVIQEIAVPAEYASGTIRVSLGRYNTEEDVLQIARTLTKIVGK